MCSGGWAPWDTEPGPGGWGPWGQRGLGRGAAQSPLLKLRVVAPGDGVPGAFLRLGEGDCLRADGHWLQGLAYDQVRQLTP